MKKNNVKSITASTIAQGALCLALVVVLFTFFKGVTNIINALFIPIVLYIFSAGKTKVEILAINLSALILVAIVYNFQVFFMLFYCLIAISYLFLFFKLRGFWIIIIMSLIISASFLFAVLLTDNVFNLNMMAITIKVFKGSFILYIGILFVEGLIISFLQYFIIRLINKRVFSRSFVGL